MQIFKIPYTGTTYGCVTLMQTSCELCLLLDCLGAGDPAGGGEATSGEQPGRGAGQAGPGDGGQCQAQGRDHCSSGTSIVIGCS